MVFSVLAIRNWDWEKHLICWPTGELTGPTPNETNQQQQHIRWADRIETGVTIVLLRCKNASIAFALRSKYKNILI